MKEFIDFEKDSEQLYINYYLDEYIQKYLKLYIEQRINDLEQNSSHT